MNADSDYRPRTEFTATPCFRKKTVKIVFPQFCQMFTKFDNFWHEDGQDDEIMQRALIFYLT